MYSVGIALDRCGENDGKSGGIACCLILHGMAMLGCTCLATLHVMHLRTLPGGACSILDAQVGSCCSRGPPAHKRRLTALLANNPQMLC